MADADPIKRMDGSIGRQPEGRGIAIRSGPFRMGLDRYHRREAPVHRVTVGGSGLSGRRSPTASLAYSVREHPSEHAHRAEFKGGD